MNKILGWIAKIALGKHLLAGVAWAHNMLDGKRSEILTGLLVIAHILGWAGVLDHAIVATLDSTLLPLLPVTLADKVAKFFNQAAAIVPELPKSEPEAPKDQPAA